MTRRDTFGFHETVLFWHTGGAAGLFGYGDKAL